MARPSARVGLHFDPRRLSRFQCSGKTGDVFGFHGDDFHFRAQRFHCQRNARDQSGPADRHDHGIDVRNLLQDFQAHRPLAGDDRRIIVAIDVGQSFLLRRFRARASLASAKSLPCRTTRAPSFWQLVTLISGACFRHHHSRRNAEQFALISERLSVIASRRRNDAALFLIGGQLRKRVARTAFLETPGALQVVELAENLHPGDARSTESRADKGNNRPRSWLVRARLRRRQS